VLPQSDLEAFSAYLRAFAALPDAELAAFASAVSVVRFMPGELFTRLGDTHDRVGLVLSGVFRVHYVSPEGNLFIRNFCKEGMPIGAYATLLTAQPAHVSIEALEPLELLKLVPEATPQASSRLRLGAGIDERLDASPVPVPEEFMTPFFRRFESAEQTLELAPGLSKTYAFPTFYSEVTTGVALFVCDYDAAARLIPVPALKPIRVGLGTALVAISSYRYERPRGMRPYNEVAISLLVTGRDTLDLPLMGLLGLQKRELQAYVIAMPVTTLENQIRGRTLWGLPKTVEHIDLREVGDDFVTTVRNREGQLVLETRVPMSGTVESQKQSVVLHSMRAGRALRSRSTTLGTFTSRSTPAALSGVLMPGGASSLSLGTAAGATVLRELHIRPTPLNTRFARGVSSVFGLPIDHGCRVH
jgi:hypothetical protein